MFWRLPPTEDQLGFRRQSLENVSGGPHKHAMEDLVTQDTVPGLLAYRDGSPIGWVAISPRSELVRLEQVPTLRSAEEPWRRTNVGPFLVLLRAPRGLARGRRAALLDAAVARALLSMARPPLRDIR